MSRIWAIAINTFREAVRDRVLHGVLGFASAVLLFSLALAQLSLNQDQRVVHDIGLASVSLFSVIVAVFLGSSLLYKEIERKTLYVILPKPIHRYEFLLGKYFGITLTALVFIAIMGAQQFFVSALQSGGNLVLGAALVVLLLLALGVMAWKAKDRTAIIVPWSVLLLAAFAGFGAYSGLDLRPISGSLLLTSAEVFVLAAIAMFFSAFSTPFLTGVFTMGVWIVGRSADDMVSMKVGQVGPQVQTILRGVAEVAPNFNLYVPGRHSLETMIREGTYATYLGTSFGYAALYSTIVLVCAAIVFRKRDFV